MTTDADMRAVLLELEKHHLSSFHVQAVIAFRVQWDSVLVENLFPRKESTARPRGYELDMLTSRLLSDVTADSLDVLRNEALKMLRVVKR